ncbi:uncharacterized protein LOC143239649 [Tachypleus tridentatus]|uniref:uncharacterized protein LOC143239649 n=1 Tax=Tachypleus tridentatus TaxID=6853 RepID=UPI003FD619DD
MRYIPQPIPPNVTELDLSGNDLGNITFPNTLWTLERLILTSSHILFVDSESFLNVPNTQEIYLGGNRLSKITGYTFSYNQQLRKLTLSYNPLTELHPRSFNGLINLIKLDLRGCLLKSLRPDIFTPLKNLKNLYLEDNKLSFLPRNVFSPLQELILLTLSRNSLETIEDGTFQYLQNMQILSLEENKIKKLNAYIFQNLSSVQFINLEANKIGVIDVKTFVTLKRLQSLNLKGNPLINLQAETFASLPSLKYIYFEKFYMCSYAVKVRVCEPRGDGISSLDHLLDSFILRTSVWVVATVACLGNILVFIGRTVVKESNDVHSFLIKNLSIADFLMGIYLLIIAGHDLAFRGNYRFYEKTWRRGWKCKLCGTLCSISTEASVLILTIITIDRYMSIKYPLTLRRRTLKLACVCMLGAWAGALILAVLPLLDKSYFGNEFYGNNGVCLPLFLHEPFAPGWEYNVFVFCLLNSLAFFVVAYAYMRMFNAITRSRIGLRSSRQQHDKRIARRFGFVVGTDFICWIPIILIKIISFTGVTIQPELNAWIAVFLLPVNSALNPLLYTATTKLFRQKVLRFFCSKKLPTPSTPSVPSPENSRVTTSSFLPRKKSNRPKALFMGTNDRGELSLLELNYRSVRFSNKRHSEDTKEINSAYTIEPRQCSRQLCTLTEIELN